MTKFAMGSVILILVLVMVPLSQTTLAIKLKHANNKLVNSCILQEDKVALEGAYADNTC